MHPPIGTNEGLGSSGVYGSYSGVLWVSVGT
mgnify:CR=1 FL=1